MKRIQLAAIEEFLCFLELTAAERMERKKYANEACDESYNMADQIAK